MGRLQKAVLLSFLLSFQLSMCFDGQLDATFGQGGEVVNGFTSFGGGQIQSVAIQYDGKIMAMGYVGNIGSNATFAIARYKATGLLDTTFNPKGNRPGLVSSSFGSLYPSANAFGGVLQPDKKIVLVGSAGNNSVQHFGIARYYPDGTLDSSFNPDGSWPGTVVTSFGNQQDNAYALALQKDGKIIAVGSSDAGGVLSCFALARYNPDGSLDTSFNPEGSPAGTVLTLIETEPLSRSEIMGVVLDKAGNIVVTGYAMYQGTKQFVIARYLGNGQLDTSFNADGSNSGIPGVVLDSFGGSFDEAYSILLQDDGKILVAGQSSALKFPSVAVCRYNSDGARDTSFNSGGKNPGSIVTLLNAPSQANTLLLQEDNKILVAGFVGTLPFWQQNFTLARYYTNGSLDTYNFNPHGTNPGVVITQFGQSESSCQDITFQKDGKIIAVGGADTSFALARYLDDESIL